MTKEQKIKIAKDLYILGNSIDTIATHLGVSKRTIQNYKSTSLKDGDDWDKQRVNSMLSSGNEKIYKNFLEYMNTFLKEIKEDTKLNTEVKVEKIAQLGDAFSKMKKIAHTEDPELYKHGIIKKTLETLILSAKNSFKKECLEELIELIDSIQEELSNVSI